VSLFPRVAVPTGPCSQHRRCPEVTIAVASLLGAEALHAAAFVEHRAVWVWAGAFFAAVCLAEWLTAWALLAWTGKRQAGWFAIVLSVTTVAVWAVSRSVGLPFGPERWVPEPLGLADSICTGLELTTVVAAGLLVRRQTTAARPAHLRRCTGVLTVFVVGALTAFGILAPDSSHHRRMPSASKSSDARRPG
jgi:hypothetical protein